MSMFGFRVRAATGRISYKDTAAKKLFSLPKGAILLRISVHVTTAFNDTGTDLLDIGTGADNAFYVNDHSVATAGLAAATLLNGGVQTIVGPVRDVFGKYIGQNGNSTLGSATVIAEYVDVND